MRWPEGPPHLALNPPFFGGGSLFVFVFCFLCCFFCSFPFLVFNRKTLFFALKRAFFVYFQCFSFFPPLTFLASPSFCFSFSVSLLLLSFFLPSCLSFLLNICFLSLSLFFNFLSSLLFFHEKNNMKILNCNFFFHQYFLFCWFPVLFFL